MGGGRKYSLGDIRGRLGGGKQGPEIGRLGLVLIVIASLLAGGDGALLYVFAHPVQVAVYGKTACMFMLPKQFGAPL